MFGGGGVPCGCNNAHTDKASGWDLGCFSSLRPSPEQLRRLRRLLRPLRMSSGPAINLGLAWQRQTAKVREAERHPAPQSDYSQAVVVLISVHSRKVRRGDKSRGWSGSRMAAAERGCSWRGGRVCFMRVIDALLQEKRPKQA